MEKTMTKVGMYGLPLDVKFCKRCVISNQRPSSVSEIGNSPDDKKQTIDFDEEGVCSACRIQEEKDQIDWTLREKELMVLCDKFRSNNGSFDVIIPGSGGKDSGYTAHIMKYKYGMNPLTVTWTPHLYTDRGRENFEAWINVGGFDNVLYTPNGRLHRHLTKLAFCNLLHPFQPFIIGQKIIGPLFADKFNIPLIMYGENPIEYGNRKKDNDILMDPSLFSRDSIDEVRLGGVLIRDILDTTDFRMSDFSAYLPIKTSTVRQKGIEVHYLGQYLKWDPQECYYYSCDNTGFRANTERTEGSYSKYSSIDDKIDPFHYYTTLLKFGIGRATYDAAMEIRNGKITREEGVNLVRKYDQEFPQKYYPEFLEYIGLTDEEFWATINQFRSKHLWASTGPGPRDWALKYVVE
jgi:N-acetyl sugar amidotransferase